MKISQRDRLTSALIELRSTPGFEPGRLVTDERRRQFVERIADHKWTRRNFARLRTTLPVQWKGDELVQLHELSYYLLPRALWAERRNGGQGWVRREQVFTLVALIQHHFGREIASAFKILLTKNGVKYRARRMLSAKTKMELVRRSPFKKTASNRLALDQKKLAKQVAELTATYGPPGGKTVTVARAPAIATGRRRIRLDD